jgi:opacity protein-like surface antigen
LAASAFAAQSERDTLKLRLQYLEIKDDSDLYVGQSAALLKDQGGWDKAELAATAGARAALAEAIEVRIQSKVTDAMQGNAQGVTELTEAITKTESDLKLADVKTRILRDFPQEGTVTVLAYLSKADYRRQLAGKGTRVYRPEYGLRLIYVATSTFAFDKLIRDEDLKSRSGIPFKDPANNGMIDGSNNADSLQGFGLEFRFRDWSVAAEMGLASGIRVYPYDPVSGLYGKETDPLETLGLSIGYDWTPWAWRVQPYLPLALRSTHVSIADYQAWAPAASAGLGLRYWPNDSLAFDVSGRYIQGLANAAITKDGKPLYTSPGKTAEPSLDGAQWQVSLLWSGF